MSKLAVPAFCICMLAAPAWAQSEDATVPAQAAVDVLETAAEPAPEQIHVVAQRPGPGMWKVTKGEHVLWVFGMYGPVPKNMQWRSQQVENVIMNSQEYLSAPSVSANPGFFRGITLLPSFIGMRKNPDGATLRDVMPAEEYARWTTLKSRYLPENDDVERERPIFAAEVLSNAARKQAGLVDSYAVRKPLLDLVKKAKLKETSSTFQLPMDNARTVLKNFKKSTLGDAVCLARTMATLEQDIEAASQRANAWAKGDMDEMRKLDFASREEACSGALMNSAAFDAEPEFKHMRARANEKWIASAEKALAANASTFAVLKIEDIFDPTGVISALAAKGYAVEQPD